jgi:D-hexose-6-phosphate mutarotase
MVLQLDGDPSHGFVSIIYWPLGDKHASGTAFLMVLQLDGDPSNGYRFGTCHVGPVRITTTVGAKIFFDFVSESLSSAALSAWSSASIEDCLLLLLSCCLSS